MDLKKHLEHELFTTEMSILARAEEYDYDTTSEDDLELLFDHDTTPDFSKDDIRYHLLDLGKWENLKEIIEYELRSKAGLQQKKR